MCFLSEPNVQCIKEREDYHKGLMIYQKILNNKLDKFESTGNNSYIEYLKTNKKLLLKSIYF